MLPGGQPEPCPVMLRSRLVRLDCHLSENLLVPHERQRHCVRASRLRPRECAEEILAVARRVEVERHIILLDAVERHPAVAELLRVVAHQQQVRQQPHHGVGRRLHDLHPLDCEGPRLVTASRILRRREGIHQGHHQLMLAGLQLHRQLRDVGQVHVSAHLDDRNHLAIHANLHLRLLRRDVPVLRREPQPMLAVARHGELRRQRLRPGDTPRCIRTGRLVAALELPRGDALRRWRGLLKRLRCLGRGEELDQLDGQPARILGPRAGRTVERIEQAEGNRVVPRGQLHLQLQHGGRLQRAVDGNGLHDVAVHTHLHARRFLA